jgi:PST family polysaccharide transporter/lipopolysaccharide exporter
MTSVVSQDVESIASNSLGKQIILSGAVLSAARLVTRALGVLSALTIPRWLGPAETGVFAVAMLAIGAIEAFTESGLVSAFIQRKTDYEQYILPVRTFSAARGVVLALVAFFAAPYVANWMNSPRSADVLRVLAILPLANGLTPMIWTLASKRLQFAYPAKYNVFLTAINLAITIPLAWYLMSVWALVWGTVISTLVGLVVSTFLGREGRGFTLDWRPLRDLQRYGFWIFLTKVVAYLYINGGNWLIGVLLNVQILAVYTLGLRFCTLFTAEAGGIINQMMLPVFSQIQDDLPRLRTGFRKSFGIMAMMVIGVGAFFCVASRDYFVIVLGSKWVDHTALFNSLLPWLTLWGICGAFSGAQSGVFQALGKPNWWLATCVVMCILMLGLLWPAVHLWGAVGVAALLGGIAAAFQMVRYVILARILHLRSLEVASHVAIPALAGVLSVTLATLVRGHLTTNVWGQALLATSVVVTVYLGTLLIFARCLYPNPVDFLGFVKETAMSRFREWRA